MASRCYLMSVSEFWEGVTGERLLKAALERIDSGRRKKAERMRAGKPQAACVGAGLLLQLAVQDALTVDGETDVAGTAEGRNDSIECDLVDLVSGAKWQSQQFVEGVMADHAADVKADHIENVRADHVADVKADHVEYVSADHVVSAKADHVASVRAGCTADVRTDCAAGGAGIRVYSALQVMELVERPIELIMDFGEKGKPYLREYPLFFNLSHSGKYVVCAVSDREIGVDIQKCSGLNVMRIAERFFAREESRALEACGTEEERRQFFFRLWARKEAYGKFLGEGLLGVASVNLLPDESSMVAERDLLWREWSLPEGYRIAMCQRAQTICAVP